MGLQDHQDASVVVYALAPSSRPLAAAAAQLTCVACLAPCRPKAAAAPADEGAEAQTVVQALKQHAGGDSGGGRKHGAADGAPGPPSPPIFDAVAQAASAASTPASASSSPRPADFYCSQSAPLAPGCQQRAAARGTAQAEAPASAGGALAAAEAAAQGDAAAAVGGQYGLVAKYHGAALDTHTPRSGWRASGGEADADLLPSSGQPLDIALQVCICQIVKLSET